MGTGCTAWEQVARHGNRLLGMGTGCMAWLRLHIIVSGLRLCRSLEEEEELSLSASILERVTSNLLPVGVFILRFLEWWYSAEKSAAVRMMTSLPVPPLPQAMKVGGTISSFLFHVTMLSP